MIKKIIFVLILTSFLGMAVFPVSVRALQSETAYVFDTTIPVDSELRSTVDMWLAENNPSSAIYYAITYVRSNGFDEYIVCLAALNLSSPDEDWSLTDNTIDGESKLIWLGTVRVNAGGTVDLLTEPQGAEGHGSIQHFALPVLPAPGGGANIRWPFETGKSVMYGPNGIHGIGYSSYGTGMVAIDLVSGSDFGSGAARNFVYAVAPGDIDYVCTDGTSDTIRVNDGADNKFIYAHLLHNFTLEEGHTFSKGSAIGSMVSGTFDDDCGNADQQEDHWHLHWGFVPANNAFGVENCTINTRTGTITCGNAKINPGQFIVSSGVVGSDDQSHGAASTTPSFWDYLLVAFISIVDRGIIKLLPEHTSPTLLPRTILTTIKFVMKVTYALLVSNFNMGPAMTAIFLALAFRAVAWIIELVFIILRTIKSIPLL